MAGQILGKTDIEISPLGLGGATFGREIDEATSFEVIDYAFENGIRFFDTAENYGGGQAREYRRDYLNVDDVRETTGEMSSSECIIGRWLTARGCRDDVVLCSKMWAPYEAERVASCVAGSLERLQTDVIDVYMIHIWNDDMNLQEMMHALSEEVAAGRVRALGCSNFAGGQLRQTLELSEAHGYARMEAIENNFNLVRREAESDVFPVCREHDVSFIGFSPLGAGFLTGKYTANRDELPERSRFDVIPGHCDVYFSDQSFARVEKLRALSEQTGHSMVRLAAAWAIAAEDVACTLFGARTVAHLENAIAAHDPGVEQSVLDEMSSWD